MKKNALLALTLISTSLLSACNDIPHAAYTSRGGPESLLNVSSEVVNISLLSPSSTDELVQWLNEDQPTRVELHCANGDMYCGSAQAILEQFAVPYNIFMSADSRATLIYDRVVARDCDHRYMDMPINPYNLNHPTFGCAISANALQMISDKQQIVSPALSDYQDADKASQNIDAYREPTTDGREFNSGILGN